jgi:hypothetical protein
VQSVFQGIYEGFYEQYRSEIKAIAEQTLSVIDRVTALDQLERFRAALNNIQRDIMRYWIELAGVPGIADLTPAHESESNICMGTTPSPL